MSELLDRAMEAARRLSPEAQDDIARLVLRLAAADDEPPVVLAPEEQAALEPPKRPPRRGEFATEAEVRAVWAKHGL